MKKSKCFALLVMLLALFVPIAASAMPAPDQAKTRIAVVLDTPLVIDGDEKIQEVILAKLHEWFPSNKYELIDVKEVQRLVNDYREENDMVVYKALKRSEIQNILKNHNPKYVVNMRFHSGTGQIVMTAFCTKINVTTDIRILDMATAEYIQRYESTNAVGSGDIWGNSSASRSYRKGIIKGLEGFQPDHTKY